MFEGLTAEKLHQLKRKDPKTWAVTVGNLEREKSSLISQTDLVDARKIHAAIDESIKQGDQKIKQKEMEENLRHLKNEVVVSAKRIQNDPRAKPEELTLATAIVQAFPDNKVPADHQELKVELVMAANFFMQLYKLKADTFLPNDIALAKKILAEFGQTKKEPVTPFTTAATSTPALPLTTSFALGNSSKKTCSAQKMQFFTSGVTGAAAIVFGGVALAGILTPLMLGLMALSALACFVFLTLGLINCKEAKLNKLAAQQH